VLSDAYERLDHWHKGHAFLERIARDGPRELKAAAWQRLCTQHLDEGDFAAAQAAFAEAQRNAPDSARTAVLEITLLAAQRKDAVAALRAHFWRRKLERAGYREEPFMDFLAQAALDPQAALVASHAETLDPPLLQLRDWIEGISGRPLPDYSLEAQAKPAGDVRRNNSPSLPRPISAGGACRPMAPAMRCVCARRGQHVRSKRPGTRCTRRSALLDPACADGRWRPLGR